MNRVALAVPALLVTVVLVGCHNRAELLRTEMDDASELDVAWSHVAASGLLAVARDSGEPGLVLVDTRSGAVSEVATGEAYWPRRPTLSPDGRFIAYHERERKTLSSEKRLYLFDRQSGHREVLADAQPGEFLDYVAFAPDSHALVYELVHQRGDTYEDELRIVDLATGADRSFFLDPHVPARAPVFGADGRAVFVASGDCVRRIDVADHSWHEVACKKGGVGLENYPQPPALSPDGREIAFTLELDGCPRIFVASAAGGGAVEQLEGCGMRPAWLPGPTRRLAYIGLPGNGSRVPRLWLLDERRTRDLGFGVGVTYDVAAEPDGNVLVLAGTPRAPRSVWRVSTSGPSSPALVYAPMARERFDDLGHAASVPQEVRIASSDGVTVPLLIFRPSCRVTRERVPAVLWVHGGVRGKEDVAPRWTQEIQSLAASGVTVLAVNYRGSTGYGAAYRARAEDLAGQIADVRAADRYLRTLPDVDPEQIYLLAVCYGGTVAAPLVAEAPKSFRGAIHWMASARAWLTAGGTRPLPSLLWLNGSTEDGAAQFPELARALVANGYPLERLELPEGHAFLRAENRRRALETVRSFIEARSGRACE